LARLVHDLPPACPDDHWSVARGFRSAKKKPRREAGSDDTAGQGPAAAGPRRHEQAQCAAALAAPTPVCARTYWSPKAWRSRWASALLSSSETRIAARKASGMENSAGWV